VDESSPDSLPSELVAELAHLRARGISMIFYIVGCNGDERCDYSSTDFQDAIAAARRMAVSLCAA
jgi:hypothetical protein